MGAGLRGRPPFGRRSSRDRWLLLAGALLVMLPVAWLAYQQGFRTGVDLHPVLLQELDDLRSEKDESDRLIADMGQQMVNLRQGARIDRDVAEQVRATVLDTNRELAALKEEIAFYRSLMAPNATETGMGIRSLTVYTTESPHRYEFELVLQQLAVKHKLLRGELSLSVLGRTNEKDVVLSLSELPGGGEDAIGFKFKYFEKLGGVLTLPDGFVPESITVKARTWRRPVIRVERSFQWLVKEKSNVAKL